MGRGLGVATPQRRRARKDERRQRRRKKKETLQRNEEPERECGKAVRAPPVFIAGGGAWRRHAGRQPRERGGVGPGRESRAEGRGRKRKGTARTGPRGRGGPAVQVPAAWRLSALPRSARPRLAEGRRRGPGRAGGVEEVAEPWRGAAPHPRPSGA